jgi:hypothetical protein
MTTRCADSDVSVLGSDDRWPTSPGRSNAALPVVHLEGGILRNFAFVSRQICGDAMAGADWAIAVTAGVKYSACRISVIERATARTMNTTR